MSGKKRSGGTVQIVTALAEPVARQLGLSLWDVRFVKEGAVWFLRILIDKPGGVGIDDCEKMSRALNPLLDQADPIEQSYCLEVGSPGIGRELTRPEHFQRFAGARVRVKLIRPGQDGRRELTGTLLSCEDSVIRLRAGEEELIAIPKKDTSSVRLLDDELVEE
ncbi:MAG TPA: ribosome maturation factor [Ruminococcaceae bacterium]|nr:ribosome maturation factor [Oscillospiraceae bacterium]